ncbi:MAG: trypsin-like serine protease, partial [Deltaproteobacteria bacterium]|nr:trypsin-like serine protease [Deltaproteobacteria bacterium]
MSDTDMELRTIVFRACLVASWTDDALSSGERRFLSHLTDTLADNEQEREVFNKLRFKDQNENQVLSEIAGLDESSKLYVFDKCLETMTSDRILSRQEQRFLKVLSKSCGIGTRLYFKKKRAAVSASKTRMQLSATVIKITAICILVVVGSLFAEHLFLKVEIRPTEKSTGKGIQVLVFEPSVEIASDLQTGQAVFERVKKSIVQVNVFLESKLICGGSGLIIGKDVSKTVYIVTNKHVVNNDDPVTGKRGDKIRFEVQLYSGARFDATLDFYSRKYDLAVLAVRGIDERTNPLRIGLKDALQVGQPVFAIGSPLDLKHSFTSGVVSALRQNYLQTDATVSSGSSGGPLVDKKG